MQGCGIAREYQHPADCGIGRTQKLDIPEVHFSYLLQVQLPMLRGLPALLPHFTKAGSLKSLVIFRNGKCVPLLNCTFVES